MGRQNITLLVKPTHACNLNCPYCYERANRGAIRELMKIEDVKQITKVFGDSVHKWIWHGGEPLLMGSDFYGEAHQVIKRNIPQAELAMQTNGTLIDEKIIEMFVRDKVRPGMSFDGINNNLTRKSTEALMRSFNLLEQAKIQFGVIMLVFSENVDSLAAEYEFFKRLGIKVKWNLVFSVATNPDAVIVDNERMVKGICDFFDYWIEDDYKPVNSEFCSDFVLRLLGDERRRVCCNINCVGRWFAIHADGKIFPCGRDWPDEYCFGNIYDFKSVDEIYESDKFIKFKERADNLYNKCKGCDFFEICKCGCYADAATQNPNLTEIYEPICFVTRKVFVHIYNRIRNLDMTKKYNPYFLKLLTGGHKNEGKPI
jgi:uncharacterized protein